MIEETVLVGDEIVSKFAGSSPTTDFSKTVCPIHTSELHRVSWFS